MLSRCQPHRGDMLSTSWLAVNLKTLFEASYSEHVLSVIIDGAPQLHPSSTLGMLPVGNPLGAWAESHC